MAREAAATPAQDRDGVAGAATALHHAVADLLGQVHRHIEAAHDGKAMAQRLLVLAKAFEDMTGCGVVAACPELKSPCADASEHLAVLAGHIGAGGQLAAQKETVWSLADDYERMVLAIRAGPRDVAALGAGLPSLRPTNFMRNVVHVANAMIGVAAYEWLIGYWVACAVMGGVLASYLLLDLGRRISPTVQRVFFDNLLSSVTRPKERYVVPSATWYALGMGLVTLLFPKPVAQVATLILGVGDPAAALVGKPFGRTKIFGQKSLEGTLGFVGASLLVALPWLVFVKHFTPHNALLWALPAAVAGAAAELLGSDLVDDNLLIPLVSALTIQVVATLGG